MNFLTDNMFGGSLNMESVSVLSSNWTIAPDWKKWKNFGNFFDAVAYESPRLIGKKENAVVLARVSRLLTKWLCNCTSIWMGTYFCLKHVYWEKVIFSSLKIDNPGRNRPMPQIWTLKSWIKLAATHDRLLSAISHFIQICSFLLSPVSVCCLIFSPL